MRDRSARPIARVILALLVPVLPVRSARLAAVRPKAPLGSLRVETPKNTAAANATTVTALSSQSAKDRQRTPWRTQAGEGLMPILWLHVPKTGSSFATTLAHFGCPSLPAELTTKEPARFQIKYPPWRYGCENSFQRFESGHAPVPPWAGLGHVVSMFREPRERLASGYFHRLHDCPPLRNKMCVPRFLAQNGRPGDCDRLYKIPLQQQKPTIVEYNKCVGGCTAHMLAGRPCGIKPDMITIAAETDSKVKALKAIKQLGFVGLTEQWPLSICLFHVRFGGNCYRASFSNVRPGKHTHRYDNFFSVADFDMGIDQAIYDAASKRFWREVHEHDVSLARCRQYICPSAVEYFQEGTDFLMLDDEDADSII